MTDSPEVAEVDSQAPLKDWPVKGGDGPQPWDHKALGIDPEKIAALEPGEENTVTPTVSHSAPILTSGSAHPIVHELGQRLGKLGYKNSVTRGENPFGHVDESIMAAVHAFRDAYNVQEDPSGFGGNTPGGRTLAAAHIGPWTTEAILRARP